MIRQKQITFLSQFNLKILTSAAKSIRRKFVVKRTYLLSHIYCQTYFVIWKKEKHFLKASLELRKNISQIIKEFPFIGNIFTSIKILLHS